MNKRILVVGSLSYADSVEGLGKITNNLSEFLSNPTLFDLALFTGGEDVHPSLYNDNSPLGMCWSDINRDRLEAKIYKIAIEHSIPMTGICRGLQFLNVMNGGSMMHDIKGHTGAVHLMTTHDKREIKVNSLHHQMILPSKDAVVIGVSTKKLSSYYIGYNDDFVDYNGEEIEAAIFPKTRCFGVQYHPEMMPNKSDGYKYYYEMVKLAINASWDEFVRTYGDIKVSICDSVCTTQ